MNKYNLNLYPYQQKEFFLSVCCCSFIKPVKSRRGEEVEGYCCAIATYCTVPGPAGTIPHFLLNFSTSTQQQHHIFHLLTI